MTYPRPDAIVFDFDLTLVNSLEGFVESHAVAAASVGLTPPARETIARTIGTPLTDVFGWLYGPEQESLRDAWLRAYQARADEVMTDLTVFLDGIPTALRKLHGAGIKLGIVSQKLRYRVEDVLRRAGQLQAFTVVLGGDDVPALKPDPAGLRLALERLAVSNEHALYVGDPSIDADTAQRAGVPFLAVLTGYATAAELGAFKPVASLASVAALPAFLGLDAAAARPA